MPKIEQCRCSPAVKKLLELNHKRCNKTHSSSMVSGWRINKLIGCDKLNEEEKVQVCQPISKKLENAKIPTRRRKKTNQADKELPFSATELIGETGREERYRRRKEQYRRNHPEILINPLNIKRISIVVGNDANDVIDFSKRNGKTTKYVEDVLHKADIYRKAFNELEMREKRNRIDDISKTILACCVDKKLLSNEGMKYLRQNEVLAVTIVNLLDGIKERLQNELKINFKVEVADKALPRVSDDEDSNSIESSAHTIFALVQVQNIS